MGRPIIIEVQILKISRFIDTIRDEIDKIEIKIRLILLNLFKKISSIKTQILNIKINNIGKYCGYVPIKKGTSKIKKKQNSYNKVKKDLS